MGHKFTLHSKLILGIALVFVCSTLNAQIIKQTSIKDKNNIDELSDQANTKKVASPVFIDYKPILYKDDQKVKYAEYDSICKAPSFITFETEAGKEYYKNTDIESVYKKYLNVRDNVDKLEIVNTTDYFGITYYRYQQYYQNIKIDGAQYVSTIKDNKIQSITGKFYSNINLNITPAISEEQGLQFAIAAIDAEKFLWEDTSELYAIRKLSSDTSKALYPKGELVFKLNENKQLVLAYKFLIDAITPRSSDYVFIDAATGNFITKESRILFSNVTTSIADTRYSGTRTITTDNGGANYRLRESRDEGGTGVSVITWNAQRCNSIAGSVDFNDLDNKWTSTEYHNANYDDAAIEAHWSSEQILDYWYNIHHRVSYDNAGASVNAYVHFDDNCTGSGYDNAYWSGSYMVFGDGSGSQFTPLTCIDVYGHELGHAVCSSTCNLVYSYESGAMNEGFSDIWGSCVEFYAKGSDGNWNMGEDITVPTPDLRNISDPTRDENPDTYNGTYWYVGASDYGGVHTNASVLAYWFYLLTEGGIGTNDLSNAYNVTGIGAIDAARIAYTTELNMTPSSQYADARTISIAQAATIFGACSQQVVSVTNAWYAVGVGAAYSGSCRDKDIEVTQVTEPSDIICGSSISPVIKVKNNGTISITSMTITYNVDGAYSSNYNWTGTIATGAFSTINMPAVNGITNGSHTYNISGITDINGVGGIDPYPSNNTGSSDFSVASHSLPYSQDFESGTSVATDFKITYNEESLVEINSYSAKDGAYGIMLDGNSSSFWTNPSGNEFTINPLHNANISLCVDATNATSLILEYDLDQIYYLSNVYTNFHLLVNGTQVGSLMQPSGATTNWMHKVVDLSAYIGGYVNITFESSCKYSFTGTGNANFIDNISIIQKFNDDCAVTGIAPNVSSCGFTSTTPINFTVTNTGLHTETNIPLYYECHRPPNNSLVGSGNTTIGSLAPGASTNYTPSLNLTDPTTTYTFTAWTTLTGDQNIHNDTMTQEITSGTTDLSIPGSTLTEGFESGALPGWAVQEGGDGIPWALWYNNAYAHTGNYSIAVYPNCAGTVPYNDYFFSKCVYLKASQTYTTSHWDYYYNSGCTATSRRMTVSLFSAQNSGSWVQDIIAAYSPPTAYAQKVSANFSPPSDGIYYIGWKLSSATNLIFVYFIDDIAITNSTAAIPTLTTNAVTLITANTARSGGNVTAQGGSAVTDRGIVYSTHYNPSITDYVGIVHTGSGTGSYTSDMSGLTASTTYYVRAFATNTTGTAYGANIQFNTIRPEPTNHVTDFNAGTPTTTTIPLTWTESTAGVLPNGYLIRGSSVSTGAIVDPTDGTAVADGGLDKNITYGTSTYTFTGLSNGTHYYFKIYPYTNSGTDINYKTDGIVPNTGATTMYASITPYMIVSTTVLNDFGNIAVGNSSSSLSYDVTAYDLTNNLVITPPTNFELSLDNITFSTNPITLIPSLGYVPQTTIYARFTPLSTGAKAGNITNASTGATVTPINIAVSGTGGTAPTITGQPSDAVVCENGNTSFTVTASGSPTYQWQVNTGGGWSNLSNGGIYSNVTTATLNLTTVLASYNIFQYRCAVSNGTPTYTNAAALTINTAPSIARQPVNTSVCAGNAASFTVIATGLGLTYQWQYNNGSWGNVADGTPTGAVYSGGTSGTLNITGINTVSSYNYQCIITGSCSPVATTSTATLTITASGSLSISAQPFNTSACEWSSTPATFSVTAAGSGGLSYQWQEYITSWNNLSNNSTFSGVTTNTLSIIYASTSMSGRLYRCKVTDASCNTMSNSASLTVNAIAVISSQPVNASTCAGTGTPSFSVTASGTGLTYQWQEYISSWNNLSETGVYTGTTSNALTITGPPASMDGRQYRCIVSTSCALASQAATLYVPSAVPSQPSVISGQSTVCQGTSQNYYVTNVSGVSYAWTIPGDWTITSGQGTSSINVAVGSVSDNIIATPTNACGTGTAQSLAATATAVPAQPSTITGNTTPNAGTSQGYSVTNVSGVTYTWTFPGADWIITAGQGTNSITVTAGGSSGYITVVPSTSCGMGNPRTLSVAPVVGAARYAVASTNWSLTSTWSATSGGTGGASVPTAGTPVYIDRGYNVTVNTTVSCLSLTMGGTVNASNGTLTLASPGSIAVAGKTVLGGTFNNTCQGYITVVASSSLTTGILQIGGDVSTGGKGNLTMSGGTLTTGGIPLSDATYTIGSFGWALSAGSTIVLNATNDMDPNLTSFISLQIKSGTTSLNANTTVTGTLTVNAGAVLSIGTFTFSTPTSLTMECGGTGSAIVGTGALTLGGNVTVNSVAGSGSALISCPITLGGNRTFTIADGTATTDLTISGVISGANNIIKAGAGNMYLSGMNAYTGTTTISAGKLSINTLRSVSVGTSSLGAPTTVANGTIAMAAGATLAYNGVGHTSNRVINLTGTGVTLDASGTGALTLSGGITGNTFNLVLSGTGSASESGVINTTSGTVTKNGTGDWALTGLNSYTGKTTISAGTLSINTIFNISGGNSSLGNPTTAANGTIDIGATGTLKYTGSGHSSARIINLLASGGTIDASGGGALTLSGGVTGNTFNLILTGSGAGIESGAIATTSGTLTKNGAGTWTLSGVNTYTGTTTINTGTLKLGVASERIANTSPLIVNGTFDLAGFSETVGALSGSGTVTSSAAGTPVFAVGDATNTTFSGVIQNGSATSVALTKAGAGTMILSGNNTYTGITTINTGTVQLGAAGVIPDASPITLTGGTLSTGAAVGYSETIGAVTLSATSTIALGTGVHTLTIANSSGATWGAFTLNITGWTGLGGASGTATAGKIMIGVGGLTAGQLAKIQFSGGYPVGAVITASGELVPVMPTTYYSQGSVTPNTLTNWNTNRGGGGGSPANFTNGEVFVVQNGHTMTTTAAWSVSGANSRVIIENGGTLVAATTFPVTLSAASYFQIDNGGTYKHQNSNAWATTIFQGTETFANSSTVEINSTATTLPTNSTYGNLIINLTVDPTANIGFAGNLTTINGNLTIQNTQNREVSLCSTTSPTVTIAGDMAISGATSSFTLTTGTGNPVVSVGGNVTMSNGTLSLSGGGGIGTLNVAGNFTHTGGTITETSTGSGAINFNTSSAKAIESTGQSNTIAFTVAPTGSGTVEVVLGKIFTISSGSSLSISNTSSATEFTVNGTLLRNSAANITTTGAMAVTTTGTYQHNVNGGVVPTSTWNLASNCNITGITNTVPSGGLSQSLGNFTWNCTSQNATITLPAMNIGGNFILTSTNSQTLNGGTGTTLNVKGNWTNNSGTFNGGSSTVNLNGTVSQTIGGSSSTIFNNLTINKTSGTVILGVNETVGGTLTMTSGNIDCGSNTLELGISTGSVGALAWTSGNIIGNFKRWINATGTGILFPVGTSADNRKALVTCTNLTPGSLTAKFIATDPGSSGLPLNESPYVVGNQFTEGYWSLVAANSLASTNYALELTGTNFSSYTEDAYVHIIKRPNGGGSWTLDGTHVAAVSPTAKRAGLNGFGEFAHAQSSPGSVWTGTTSEDWNVGTNWNPNGVPTPTTNVYIPLVTNQPHVTLPFTSPAQCNALYICSGAILTIDPSGTITVHGTTTLNGSECLIIKTEGSFIDNGISGTGTARVEKELAFQHWWYIGSPLSSSVTAQSAFGSLSTVSGQHKRLGCFIEANHAYTYLASADNLDVSMRGYCFKDNDAVAPTTVTFSGSLNTGTKSVPSITRQNSGTFLGFNLICNPYPSAINLGSNAVQTPGLTWTNIQTTFWFYNNGSYKTYNWTSGTGIGTTQYVPAMQSFWVRVAAGQTSGTFSIDNRARCHNDQTFYKTGAETNVFRIQVQKDSLNDEAVVAFYSDAIDIFDPFDSEKMFSDNDGDPQIYTMTADNTVVAINGQPELIAGTDRIVPLGFMTNIAGTFKLMATNMSEFDPNISVYLEDSQLNYFQKLNNSDSYTFTSGVVDDDSRFKLHFGNLLTDMHSDTEYSVFLYVIGNAVYVNTPENCMVEIYNTVGEKIADQKADKGLNKIQSNISQGIYIVKILTGSDIVTKKVFIGN
jgi:bacillolysin